MAISELKRYAVTKCISCAAYDAITEELLAFTKHTKTFNVTDNTETSYLEGGENMDKLLAITGKQEAQIKFTTATDSLDWKALQLNSKVETLTKNVPTDEYFTVESKVVKLENAVKISKVFVTDSEADGRDDEEIKVVTLTPAHYVVGTTLTIVTDGTSPLDPDTQVEESTVLALSPTLTVNVGDKVDLIPAQTLQNGQCTVNFETGEVKFMDDMEDKEVHIFYDKQMETSGYKSNGGKSPNIKFVATCVFTDVDTKKQFIGKYIAYQASVQQNDNTQADNGNVPSDIEYTIDCLKSRKHGCTYEVVTCKREDLAE